MAQPIKTTKYVVFALFWVVVATLLAIKLFQAQVIDGKKYQALAEGNRFYTQRLPALRGVIIDRFGDPIVWNVQQFFQVENPGALYEKTSPISRDIALQKMATDSASVNQQTQRLYRFPSALAHVQGYVGDVTAEDLERSSEIEVGQQIGKAGLELFYQKSLRGQDGRNTYEIDALGHKLRLMETKEAIPGQNLETSIDPYVTEIAAQALRGKRGAVVITDASTGQVLALTSSPSYNSNILSQSEVNPAKEEERKALVQTFFTDPLHYFFDRAISGSYPPGSIFKLVVGLAGLEKSAFSADTQVQDEGVIKLGEFVFGNWYYRQYGRVEGAISLVRAIARSNDIYFYKAAEWTGPESIALMSRLLGLGGKTGIDLPAETKGLVPDPEWKQSVKSEKWYLGDTYHMGIGQGDLLTSPIQLAQLTQAMANRGQLCQVSIAKQDKKNCRQAVLNEDHLRTILEGMVGVCSSGGTAFPFFPYNTAHSSDPGTDIFQQIDNGAVACKTGTAEFGGQDSRGYRKTHGWFTSIISLPSLSEVEAPEVKTVSTATSSATLLSLAVQKEDASTQQDLWRSWRQRVTAANYPKMITITVLVESDEVNAYREGSIDAAPIAKKILDWMVLGGKSF